MILFLTNKYSALAYTSHTYLEALSTQQYVSYIPYATSYHEKTCDIITFTSFEEGGLLNNNQKSQFFIRFWIQIQFRIQM